MRLLPWLACLFAVVVAASLAVALARDATGARAARDRVKAFERLKEQDDARLIPVPALKTSETFGAPYNVTIVCTVAGSGEGENGARIPLDTSDAPHPGDLYVKTCRATR